MLGKVLGLQLKLSSHLERGDHSRVRDYMIQIVKIWPDPKSCSIDPDLLKRALDFLHASGYFISIDPKRGVVFTSPSGRSYGTFEVTLDPQLASLRDSVQTGTV